MFIFTEIKYHQVKQCSQGFSTAQITHTQTQSSKTCHLWKLTYVNFQSIKNQFFQLLKLSNIKNKRVQFQLGTVGHTQRFEVFKLEIFYVVYVAIIQIQQFYSLAFQLRNNILAVIESQFTYLQAPYKVQAFHIFVIINSKSSIFSLIHLKHGLVVLRQNWILFLVDQIARFLGVFLFKAELLCTWFHCVRSGIQFIQ
ncbi:Hypothetical_protein [Hexamita inflata]|uniref:Hypothetical_protein n=1 Tax=Hexamita inflata TaxID=28002 RepID=A0ABP1HI02_9EUKA